MTTTPTVNLRPYNVQGPNWMAAVPAITRVFTRFGVTTSWAMGGLGS